MSKATQKTGVELLVALIVHVPWVYGALLLFQTGAHWLAVYLLTVTSLNAARSVVAAFVVASKNGGMTDERSPEV